MQDKLKEMANHLLRLIYQLREVEDSLNSDKKEAEEDYEATN